MFNKEHWENLTHAHLYTGRRVVGSGSLEQSPLQERLMRERRPKHFMSCEHLESYLHVLFTLPGHYFYNFFFLWNLFFVCLLYFTSDCEITILLTSSEEFYIRLLHSRSLHQVHTFFFSCILNQKKKMNSV